MSEINLLDHCPRLKRPIEERGDWSLKNITKLAGNLSENLTLKGIIKQVIADSANRARSSL